MGTYVNPGNSAFNRINDEDYVDKTLMIDLINKTIDKKNNLTCISRPRRFGKSYVAKMLVAYYDCSCKSEALFDNKKIAKTELYKEHMNKYNVVRLDIAAFVSIANRGKIPLSEIPNMIVNSIHEELLEMEPGFPKEKTLTELMNHCAKKPKGRKFVFVIDEWDAVIREAKHDKEAQKSFLDLLREWFRNEMFTSDAVAAAYMTGILPIKKDEGQTALSDFHEYSILEPGPYAPYFGFIEEEVKDICDKHGMDFAMVKRWYDGYTVGQLHSVYNPYSVMEAAMADSLRYSSHWKKTSAAEALTTYIDIDMDGLQDTVSRLVAGESVEVDTYYFENDMETFTDKNDVLTLLVHLGYLSFAFYDEEEYSGKGLARIPNKEVETEFAKMLRKARHKRLVELVRASDQLLKDVLAGNEAAVASAIHDVHDSHYAPTFYSNEQSLRSVVRLACVSWVDQYGKIEELPSGHGVADIAFFPRRESPLPGIVMELKWDKGEEGAIKQIKDRNYQKALEDLVGDVVLVGIEYGSEDKKHACRIERIRK